MSLTKLEETFTIFDTTSSILQEELSCTYLEALAETAENLFHQDVLQDELSELTKKRLLKEYDKINLQSLTKEEVRKGFQLAILKGMKEGAQVNHQMTPDAISLFIGFLVSKFNESNASISILDPAVGTGNLLTAVLNQLSDKKLTTYGIDVDDLLIKLAYQNSNLQQHPIEFYTQDSLQNLYIEPVDTVISDIPYGFYPDDVNASNFELKRNEGHSYAHHLYIEQSIKYTKPGGYLFFLVPNAMFEGEESKNLHVYLKDHVYIQGLLQLPFNLFKSPKHAKSIFILQKKAINVEQPKQALLVNLPSFSKKDAMSNIMGQINDWIQAEKRKK
ncbi:class I SAM-dependent methyltransferase [Sutcliffiella cohnii]|uniref:SAM-dependent methyltransferase n=1 Tax=Sutcliffiella cohnii TaxID=33932 RepID=A0A223KTM8_9BACI|nr:MULTISPECIES: class I SAM-dependent methyltransferase [Sutcliffiella]AST92851.1 SAM-dependent methyltransferase [Sutcliffiella cohnii]MED4016194.1 class I SAM-dependent methyltransferase [Sutcliffiella cohnii]WBL14109.1 class I SAM-dependent methyltransferase [Sutcliffiella sp. NC1]